MSSLNISLPPLMRTFVITQIRSGQYSSASDYVRTLIRADQLRQATAPPDALAQTPGADGVGAAPAPLRKARQR